MLATPRLVALKLYWARTTTSNRYTYLFRRTNSSRLNGKFAHVARSRAPPAAEKTEESMGAFTPKAIVIVSAKVVRRTPLNKAVVRVSNRELGEDRREFQQP